MFDEPEWDVCQRCSRTVDRREVGLVRIVWEVRGDPSEEGVLNPTTPHEVVCYECADELLEILGKCGPDGGRDCLECPVVTEWSLSLKECILNKMKWGVIPKPEPTQEEWVRALSHAYGI